MSIPTRRKKSAGRKTITHPPELGLTLSGRRLIERAMAGSGLTLGDLAYEGARQILAAKERLVLAGADRAAFLKAVTRPRVPTGKLVAALKRRREIA
jgi:uncharacterized protein (DUF1778 family)